MKVFLRFAVLAAYTGLLTVLIVLPSHGFRIRLYKGQRPDTITQISIIPLEMTVSFKRLPLDNLILFPVKTLDFLDVSFVHSVRANNSRPRIKDTRSVKESSLAYCYLIALDRLDITLPVSSNLNKNCVYDVSNYTSMSSFKLTELDTRLMSEKTYPEFIGAFSGVANKGVYNLKSYEEGCIVEITSNGKKRYVYCYRIEEERLYIIDPENLRNLASVIEDGKYEFLADVWEVTGYYGIAGE